MPTAQPLQMQPDTAYMEVPRCDACKFWQHGAADCGTCTRAEMPGNKAAVTYDRQARLHTTAAFGCVQFEKRA